jgi:8-oxo-dGTP pyrophosphatase MutT (NUDIX family)
LGPTLARSARAALRETWEEAAVLIGRMVGSPPPVLVGGLSAARERMFAIRTSVASPIEQAYRERGLIAAMDVLTYVGRAITPSHSPRRFNTRFFLGDGENVFGEPVPSEELEDLRWHSIRGALLESFRDVTRFMLARAVALRTGTDKGAAPLFYWAKNARRIGVCREGATGPAAEEKG